MTVIARAWGLGMLAMLVAGCQPPAPVAETQARVPPPALHSQDGLWATKYDWVPDDALAGTCGISAAPPEPWVIIRGQDDRAQFHAMSRVFGLVETSGHGDTGPMDYRNAVLATVGKDNLAGLQRGVAEKTARMIRSGEIARISRERVRAPQKANVAAIVDMYPHGRFYVFAAFEGEKIPNRNNRVDLWLSDDGKETIVFAPLNDAHDATPVPEYQVTYTKILDDNIVVEIKGTSQALIRMPGILRSLEPVIDQCRKEIQPDIQAFWKWRETEAGAGA